MHCVASFLLQSQSEQTAGRFLQERNKHQRYKSTQAYNEDFGTVEGKTKQASAEEALSSFPCNIDILLGS